LFEYLAVRRPMLAISPAGEAAELVRSVHPDGWRDAGDVPGVIGWLRERLSNWQPGAASEQAVAAAAIAPYERRALAGQMAALLDRIAIRA
jgi:hypothetical protein